MRVVLRRVLSLCFVLSLMFYGPCMDLRAEEFVGPFSSWTNVKTVYGATGNGATDDTAAIQNALNDLGTTGHSPILYFPSGTYKITQTLNLAHTINVGLIGQDPSTTSLVWGGSSGGIMIFINSVAYSKFSRLTFDGRTSALVAVEDSFDGANKYFDTGNEYSDDTFTDVGFGIRGGLSGYGFAETSVERSHFIRNSVAGIALENFNALDLWVWYSTFENCNEGVSNNLPDGSGAGAFHVFNSLFLNSTYADLSIGNTSVFSARHNYSSGSGYFLVATGTNNPAPIDIVGNTILDPQNSNAQAIVVGNQGPGLVMDNVIRNASALGSAIWWNGFVESDVMTVGNTFTVSNPISNNGRAISIDDQVVARTSVNPVAPILPGTLPNLNRQVFEVAPGATADAIQLVINNAAAKNGNRAVVHIPYGLYQITKTLEVPASDVQIIGDGEGDIQGTILHWAGSNAGPVFQVDGPSQATFRDLEVDAAGLVDGIVVGNVDQTGSRVYMDQAQLTAGRQTNLLVDGLDNTYVQLENFQYAGSLIKAIGGPGAAAGSNTPGKVDIFSGASANSNVSYDISGGAKLLVRDLWYESGVGPGFAFIHDLAQFTVDAARISSPVGSPPAFNISGLNGKVSIMTIELDDRITLSGDGSNAAVMGLDIFDHNQTPAYFTNSAAPAADARLINSRMATANPALGSASIPTSNIGVADPVFIKNMLAQTRGEVAQPPNALAPGVTDVRFFRVRVTNGINDIILQPSGLPYNPPAISAFSASPASILSGQSATLSWSVAGATSLSIDNGVGNVTGLTSKIVSPTTTTIYTLTSTNSSGPVSRSVTVTVNGAGGPGNPSVPVTSGQTLSVQVYPNPWRSDKHAAQPTITFAGLTTGTTIKLFTASGHKVKELHTDGPSVPWDLTNDSGDKVASGIYIYIVTDSQGDKVRGKIGVIK